MPSDTIYVRVKRQTTTIFAQIKPKDPISNLKLTISDMLGSTVAPADIRLLVEVAQKPGQHTVLDENTLVEKVLANEAVVFMTFKKSNDKWEDVNVAQPESHNASEEEEEDANV